jgi:hypothetical protein
MANFANLWTLVSIILYRLQLSRRYTLNSYYSGSEILTDNISTNYLSSVSNN